MTSDTQIRNMRPMFRRTVNFKRVSFPILVAIVLLACTSWETWRSNNASLAVMGYGSSNLWSHIRDNFKLSGRASSSKVDEQLQWITQHRTHMYKMANKAAPYIYYIYQEIRKRGLPTEMALIPMIESAYDPFAYSHAGAAGLWQLMPRTATDLGIRQNWWFDGRRDIYDSTQAALDYMLYLNDRFKGDWLLTLAAYDAGEGTVQNAINRNAKQGLPTDFWSLKLPQETKDYVPRLLALAEIVKHPNKYPVRLPNISHEPYFAQVTMDKQIDLTQVAKLASISLPELYKLNPGYNRWTTDPNGPHRIVLPIDKIDQFKIRLALLPGKLSKPWVNHTVKQGDTVASVAQQYGVTTALVKTANQISQTKLPAGKTLMIPTGGQVVAKTGRAIAAEPTKIIYTVKSTDSLAAIATRFAVKTSSLRFWNNLQNSASLKAGENIVIWTYNTIRGQGTA